MSAIKEFLEKVKNRDEDTLNMIKNASKTVNDITKDRFDSELIEDVELVTKKELIIGYMVTYQYRFKIILEKNKDGKDVERKLSELNIISIVMPLSYKAIKDKDNIIANKIADIINTKQTH